MKKIKYLLLLLIILLTGCSNYQELTDIAITTAIAVDYSTETNEYNLLTQVVNSVKKDDASTSNEPSFLNFYSSASSLTEAMDKIVLESPRKLYTAQCQILLLSKEVIENNLDELLDYFVRNPEMRGEMKVILTPNKEDLKGITIQTLLDNLSSSNIVLSLEESEKKGYTTTVTLNDLLEMYLNPYKEIILPTIYVEGNLTVADEEANKTSTVYKGTVKVGNMAIFKETTLVDYLSLDNQKYLNIIRGKLKNTNIKAEYNEGYLVYELYEIKTKIIPNVKDNTITLSFKGKAKTYETITNTNIENISKVKDMEKYLNNYLENNIIDTFNSIRKKYNTDIFNFRDTYYKNNPRYFKKNYNSWYEDTFPKLKLKVKSNIELYEKGKLKEEIKYVKENR